MLSIIIGFILPRLFLEYYGSEVYGLISSITTFLSFIVLMELGIGAVVQTALYKPLSSGNNKEISKILKSAKIFFNKVVLGFLIYLLGLVIFYPKINTSFSWSFTVSLILIIAFSSIAQYFFGLVYQLLFSADQRAYIPNTLSILTLVLNAIFSIILIKNGFSIQIVKLFSTIVFLLRPVFLNYYAKKRYIIIEDIKINEEPIKQKWNGIAQHVAYFIFTNTDVIILTIFSTLTNVSIYHVYNLVVNGIRRVIRASIAGVQSFFGNMLSNEEYVSLKKRFSQFEWMMHTLVTILFTCTAILIIPFITVYTNGINDANYYQPIFGLLLTFSVAFYCIRLPYNIMVLAAGHYKQTQRSAIIEMLLNILLSVILVSQFGLIGVAIGTLVAMIYRTIFLAHYLSNNILNYKFYNFIKHLFIDIIVFVVVYLITYNFKIGNINYINWFILSTKVFITSIIISLILNFVFYKEFLLSLNDIFKILKRKN